jgi:hypothetical protein
MNTQECINMESISFTQYLSFAFLALVFSSSSIYAAEPALPPAIGQVVWVKNNLKAQQPNAESRALARRSSIYEHDTITSDTNSSGEVSFTDDSALALQENSTVKIDQYSHKKESPTTDTFVVNVIKGGFRTVTGAISKNNPGGYKATTPVGTIGVMGTMFSLYYDPVKGSLAAKLDKGSIVVSNKNGKVTLTKCGSGGNKKSAGRTACVNKLYAEVKGANAAPETVAEKPAVFDSEPTLTLGPGTPSSGGTVGSFCIN